MLQRFEGVEGKRRLENALLHQSLVQGSEEIALAIVADGSLREIASGESIIHEGNFDDGMFFIVAGSFAILVKGKLVASREAGTYVGEIAILDPSQPRSASVVAEQDSVVVEVKEEILSRIAETNPLIWKRMAIDIAGRLVERNRLVGKTNEQARLFIMSSTESLPIAQEIQSGLSHENLLVTIWTNGAFLASQYPLESLENELEKADFAIAIARPDDVTESRESKSKTPRDNVVFELGLFVGRLGRERTFLVEPRDDPAKLPSDLKGLTTITYRSGPTENLPSLLGPACTEMRKLINSLGPR